MPLKETALIFESILQRHPNLDAIDQHQGQVNHVIRTKVLGMSLEDVVSSAIHKDWKWSF